MIELPRVSLMLKVRSVSEFIEVISRSRLVHASDPEQEAAFDSKA